MSDDSGRLLPLIAFTEDLSKATMYELEEISLRVDTTDASLISAFNEIMRRTPFSEKILPSMERIVLKASPESLCELLLRICSFLHHDLQATASERVKEQCSLLLQEIEDPLYQPLVLLSRSGLGDPAIKSQAQRWLASPEKYLSVPSLTPLGNQVLTNAITWAALAVVEGRQPLPMLY